MNQFRPSPAASTSTDVITSIPNSVTRDDSDIVEDTHEELALLAETPDVPACDECGTKWSGNLICSQCQSAFYCSKACQSAAWKHGGHKQNCAGMKADCERIGAEVVAAMKVEVDKKKSGDRTAKELFERLDAAGPYEAAMKIGLHDAMQHLFQLDCKQIRQRFAKVPCVYIYTPLIMSILFRGGRIEGRGEKSRRFKHMDGKRIKAYVESGLTRAFEDWFEASILIISFPFDDYIASTPGLAPIAYSAARNMISSWFMIWANKRASKAILAPNNTDIFRIRARVQFMAKLIRNALDIRRHVPDDRDPNGDLRCKLQVLGAMIQIRCRKLHRSQNCINDIDVNALLKPKGLEVKVQRIISIPIAEATIKKGSVLTNDEARLASAA